MVTRKVLIMALSIENRIKSKIYSHGRGWCFTLKDFSNLGSVESIKISVHRLAKNGMIKRIIIGLYHYPKKSKLLGDIPPSSSQIANALANKYKIKIQPSGTYAANLLGLSDQVPAKVVYLTDGASKKIKIGKRQIIFKKTTPKNMMLAGKISGLIIQALKYLGKEHIDEKKIRIIKRKMTPNDKKILAKDTNLAPNWVAKIIKEQILKDKNG